MKKVITIFVILFSLLTPQYTNAAEVVSYPNNVNVSILLSTNTTLKVNGSYQIVNNDTKKSTIIPNSTTLSIKKESSGVTVNYTGFSEKSTSGFYVEELAGDKKIAVFKANGSMHSGATTSYKIVKSFQAGESADYISSYTNNIGETWYNISSGSTKGWVLSNQVTLSNTTAGSLGTLSNGTTYRGSFYLKPNGSQIQVINYLDIEDYLKGVVPSEMPASWPKEALKAQAISARSYASNLMLLTDTAASQVYKGYSGEDSRTNVAIKETEGLLVKYNGKPIQTFFFSTSGGKTANVSDVWNSNQSYFPYLVSVDDPYESSPYSNWSETFSAETILKSFGFPTTAKLKGVTVTKSGANGEVRGVKVSTSAGDKEITGSELDIRKAFPLQSASHYNALYSNWFTMQSSGGSQTNFSVKTSSGTTSISDVKGQSVQTANGQVTLNDSNVSIQTSNGIIVNNGNEELTSVTLSGKGWGHRVGMSQYGAKGFAEKGWKAEQIITHYFKGTTVSK
jgi:SpoIID/LytB domain protein